MEINFNPAVKNNSQVSPAIKSQLEKLGLQSTG